MEKAGGKKLKPMSFLLSIYVNWFSNFFMLMVDHSKFAST